MVKTLLTLAQEFSEDPGSAKQGGDLTGLAKEFLLLSLKKQ